MACLQHLVSKLIGRVLVMLGKIPADKSIERSMRIFQPLVDLAPKSLASMGLDQIMPWLLLYIAYQNRASAQLSNLLPQSS